MKKRLTSAELMAQLNADPEYRARLATKQEARQRMLAEWRHAEQPLVEALKAAGWNVQSAWDFVKMSGSYSSAIPILLDHLQRPYPAAIREGIARALAVPEGRFAWNVLTGLFRKEGEQRAKDGLAVALAAIADDELIGDVISLASDRTLGSSRVLLLHALEKSDDPRAHRTLLDLETDPDVNKEVKIVLKRMQGRKRKKARHDRSAETEGAKGKPPQHTDLVEASTGLDSDDLVPFLERVTSLVLSGFGPDEVRRVVELTEELEIKEEGELEFEIEYDGRASPMKVRILMSDSDAPDVTILAPHKLAARISEEMETFADERGM